MKSIAACGPGSAAAGVSKNILYSVPVCGADKVKAGFIYKKEGARASRPLKVEVEGEGAAEAAVKGGSDRPTCKPDQAKSGGIPVFYRRGQREQRTDFR